jgi:hypothetical protein
MTRVALFTLGFFAGAGLSTLGLYYAIKRVTDEVLA